MKKVISSLLAAVFTLSTFASCSSDENNNQEPQTYVLVHGAWQSPYVWDEVKTNLTKKGNKVIVVELPAHGKDNTPTHTVSMDVYRDKVIDAVSKAEGKVILVGHSMGGMVVTAVAESIPSKINKLVYIGAFIPLSGQSLGELAITDPDSQLGPSLSQSADHLTLDVNQNDLTRLFINDGSPAVKQKVIDNYRSEPAIPFSNAVTLTNQNFGSVQKVYIKTLQDIVISPKLQDQMITSAGITSIYQLNTSHSPFLSKPAEVSNILLQIAK